MPSPIPTTDKHKIPFGLRDGQMAHVQDVVYGKGCGCVCAECLKPLIASNREPRKVAKYFRHDTGAECPGGYETAIHRSAKEALLRCREVTLPGRSQTLSFSSSDGRKFTEIISLSSRSVTASEAHEEIWQEDMRPDVVFLIDGQPLYIEIRVTHAVDEIKKQKIRAKDHSAIEIDLSNLTAVDIIDMQNFEKRVCHELENRLWVYWPEFEKLSDSTLQRLRAMRDAHEQRLKELEELRRQKEAAKQERLRRETEEKATAIAAKATADAERRNRLRHQYIKELTRLQEFQVESRVAEWDNYLQKFQLYKPQQGQFLPSSSFLLSKVEGFWIFNARYQDWQAYVLDLLFPPTPIDTPISIKIIKDAVLSKFKVEPWIKTINDLEFARKRYPDSDKGFVLYTTEVGVVPDPYTVISRYVVHLSSLKLAGQRLEWIEGDRSITLRSAIDRYHKWQGEKLRKIEQENAFTKREFEARKQQLIVSIASRREHEYAILASELNIHRNAGAKGLRCRSCYLLNPTTIIRCLYCGNPVPFKIFYLDEEYLRTSKHRVKTSAEVSNVLLNLPPNLYLDELRPLMDEVMTNDINSK